MPSVDLEIDDKAFKSYMKAFASRSSNLEPALREYSTYHKKETLQRTNSGLDYQGKAFEPLKPATLLRKQGRGILLETEEMIKSLYYDPKKLSLTYGITDRKYVFHHRGTSRLPQRRILGDSQDDRKKLIEILRVYLKRVRAKNAR